MNTRRSTAAALLAVFLLPVGVSCEDSPKAGDVRLEKRKYKTWSGKTGEYEVGTFYVRENRSEPQSRIISIGFSRFRAAKPTAPPVFFLPGGPGNTYQETGDDPQLRKTPFYIEYLWDTCDVVLVDQRGFSRRGEVLTGYFKGREPKPDQTLDDRVTEYKHIAQSISKYYAKTKTDLRGYTVLECVEDVNELREALGYKKISLRGQSFGCQWSFAFMRKHPELVERALLSGIEPLNHTYDMPSHIFAAVKRMWKVIDADPQFAPFLPKGGMEEAAETVIKRLEKDPIEVRARSFLGFGSPAVVRILGPDDFPWDEPDQILELYHGQTRRWARLRQRMRGTGVLIHPLIDSSLGVTRERRDKLWNDPAVRYLSRKNFAFLLATSDIWPTADVGDEFREPQRSEIPVVFVNGDWDRNTPIENMSEIAPFFSNSHSLTVHRGGHGTIGTSMYQEHPKVLHQLMAFLRNGSIEGLPDEITFRPSRQFEPPKFKLKAAAPPDQTTAVGQ
jgi:pimeloyl-ACP methyl ester carboxylesterase